jgi:hypothetical protein
MVVADANRMRDGGSPFVTRSIVWFDNLTLPGFGGRWGNVSLYGRSSNSVGDGIFGKIMVGAGSSMPDLLELSPYAQLTGTNLYIDYVDVGEGLNPTIIDIDIMGSAGDNSAENEVEFGRYMSSGIYSSGIINVVRVTQYGQDENGIYGDIVSSADIDLDGVDELMLYGIEPGDPVYATNRVIATGGAVIDGTDCTLRDAAFWTGSSIGTVSASGRGARIEGISFEGPGIHRVITSGGTDGLINCTFMTGMFGLDLLSIDGPGIFDCQIFENGPGGIIQTTGPNSIIDSSTIEAIYGLKRLDTNAFDNSIVYVTTLGSSSNFDYIIDSDLFLGGLRTVRVADDIINSIISIPGPLMSLTVGGSMVNSTVEATGPWADMGRVNVSGDIISSVINSGSNLDVLQAGGDIINTDIIAAGSGDLDADFTRVRFASGGRIIAGGSILGGSIKVGYVTMAVADPDSVNEQVLTARLQLLKAGGDISTSVEVGIYDWEADANSDTRINVQIGSISARGDIAGDIIAGAVYASAGGGDLGDVNGDVDITVRMGRVTSGADIDGTIIAGQVQAANDITGDITMSTRMSGAKATGDINGNLGTAVIVAGGDITGDISVPEMLGPVMAGGSINGDITVGTVDAAGTVFGDVTFASRLSSLKAGGDITGDIWVGSATDGLGLLPSNGFGQSGAIKAGGSITGDMHVSGNVASIIAEGTIGNNGGMILIEGNAGRISAGSRSTTGDLLSDLTVDGNLASLSVTGAFPGSLEVGGNAGRVMVTGDVGEVGDVFEIGGRVGNITVGNVRQSIVSDLVSQVDIVGNLGSVSISGNLGSDGLPDTFDVGGNVGRVYVGRIYSDITVTGNLSYLDTQSGVQPGANPPDYEFYNGAVQTGTLTVGGRIGRVNI